MSLGEERDFYQQKAFGSVVKSLDFGLTLPNRVLVGFWSNFLFFQSDHIFTSDFPEVVSEFLGNEGAHVACLLNIDKTKKLEYESIAAIFLDMMVSGVVYDEKLRAGGPANGWLYGVDAYACTSDVSEWCIYCERSNDVAVVGLRNAGDTEKFRIPLRRLGAKPIDELIDGGSSPVFPFNKLVPAWRHGLVQNYGINDSGPRS